MANTFPTPSLIAKQAMTALYETNVMAGLVWRDFDSEFTGKQGDTIMVRKPAKFVAQEYSRATGVVVQDVTEGTIPVTLNHLVDVTFELTAEQRTLTLDQMAERTINPAMEAIAQKIDADLLALRGDITQAVGTVSGELWSQPEVLIAAKRVLNQQSVAVSRRRAVVGSITAGEWQKSTLLKQADQRGDTVGREEAYLGARLFGFDPYETNHITVPSPQGTGISTTEEGVAFHPTAFVLATRALALPLGARDAGYLEYKGFTLRVVYDYSQDRKADIISIDTLYGVKTMDPNRAVLLRGAVG